MRVVLDTNVLVSGLLNPHGPPGRVVDFLLANELIPLFDDRILLEYREVLYRPKFPFRPDGIESLLALIEGEGEPVVAPPLSIDLPDSDDLPFLEVAVACVADALATGNPRHFERAVMDSFPRVSSPRAFVDAWRREAR